MTRIRYVAGLVAALVVNDQERGTDTPNIL